MGVGAGSVGEWTVDAHGVAVPWGSWASYSAPASGRCLEVGRSSYPWERPSYLWEMPSYL